MTTTHTCPYAAAIASAGKGTNTSSANGRSDASSKGKDNADNETTLTTVPGSQPSNDKGGKRQPHQSSPESLGSSSYLSRSSSLSSSFSSSESPTTLSPSPDEVAEALALAKSSCPAFRGGTTCPFRDATDAESMRKALQAVPASHVCKPAGSGKDAISLGISDGGGKGNGVDDRFRIALEHVHRVGMTLHRRMSGSLLDENADHPPTTTTTATDDTNATDDANATTTTTTTTTLPKTGTTPEVGGVDDKFLLKGGCPFKTLYRVSGGVGPGVPFVDAMERFSLGAILAHLADVKEEAEAEAAAPAEAAAEVAESAAAAAAATVTTTTTDSEAKQKKDDDDDNDDDNDDDDDEEARKKREAGNEALAALAFDFGTTTAVPDARRPPVDERVDSSELSKSGPTPETETEPAVTSVKEVNADADTDDHGSKKGLQHHDGSDQKEPLSSSSSSSFPSPKTQPRPDQSSTVASSGGAALSVALKSGTAESHAAAESVHFVSNFVKGRIDRDLFARLTVSLYHAYTALEDELDRHGPTLFPTLHHPTELNRKHALEDDVEFFYGDDWRTMPDRSSSSGGRVGDPSPATRDYCDRIRWIGRNDPLLLLSHAYTRYLGDLSGGRVLMRVARRALNLGGSDDGLRFYKFDKIDNAKVFKDRYRRALDGLDLDSEQVKRLVAEANVAFVLNMRLFEELDVAAGVQGSKVRPVEDAIRFYDEAVRGEKELREKKGGTDRGAKNKKSAHHGEAVGTSDAAKCPFAGLARAAAASAPASAAAAAEENMKDDEEGDSIADSSSEEEDNDDEGEEDANFVTNGGGVRASGAVEKSRCPWPFIFFHDPATGMKDWQTWAVFGLIVCWIWSNVELGLAAAAGGGAD